MLKINNKDYEVTEETIKFTKSKINNKEGYSLLLSVDFKEGYLTFYIDFFYKKDFKKIENKIFTKKHIKMFELYYDNNFIDYIDGEIFLKFGTISNNSVETILKIDDQEVKLDFISSLTLIKD